MDPTTATREISEHHAYLRQMFELLVTWFIFFITVLLTAYSWILVSDARSKIKNAVKQLGIFFLVQIALGIGACITAAYYFRRSGDTLRALTVAAGLSDSASAFPEGIWLIVCGLMAATLVANIGFWLWLMFARKA